MKKIFTLCFFIFQSIVLFAGAPTVPSSSFVFSNIDGTKFSVRFISGNGSSRIVVMKAGSPVTGLPVIYYFVLQDGANRYTKKLIKQ